MPQPILLLHLDFTGVLPRPAHLPQLLRDIKSLGYDGIVVEYEDIFPFAQKVAWRPRERWSRRTLRLFLDEAARLEVEVVPLQQTLSHLEWVLRQEQYRSFALGNKYPSTIDIFNPEAVELVKDMLRQVLAAHPGRLNSDAGSEFPCNIPLKMLHLVFERTHLCESFWDFLCEGGLEEDHSLEMPPENVSSRE